MGATTDAITMRMPMRIIDTIVIITEATTAPATPPNPSWTTGSQSIEAFGGRRDEA
ncbi:MAG: hypothetical protein JSR98_05965 [Proteobacteria bacterium]|nr:hypothetical protein [Pseudomonadota bacterium]